MKGQRNQCPTCGLLFTRNSSFDHHRIGRYSTGLMNTSPDRRCLTIEEMSQDARFSLRIDGFWAFSDKPGTNPFGKTRSPASPL